MDHVPTFDEIRNGGFALAVKLSIEKKYDEAKKVLTEVLKVSSKDPEIMAMMAEIFIAENKLSEAKAWLDKILALFPDYPQALYSLGVIYHSKKKWNKAITVYERAIRNFPKDSKEEKANAYQNLGSALWEERRREEEKKEERRGTGGLWQQGSSSSGRTRSCRRKVCRTGWACTEITSAALSAMNAISLSSRLRGLPAVLRTCSALARAWAFRRDLMPG